MAIQNVIRAIDARNYRITQHADEEPIHSVSAYVETNQQAILITVYRHRPGTLDQLAEKEDVMVTLLDKCPVCGGEIVESVLTSEDLFTVKREYTIAHRICDASQIGLYNAPQGA